VWVGALINDASAITSGGNNIGQFQIDTGTSQSNFVNFGYNTGNGSSYKTSWGFATGAGEGGTGFVGSSLGTATVAQNATTFLVMELVYNGAGSDAAYLYENPTSTPSTSSAIYSLTGLSLSGGTTTGAGTYIDAIGVIDQDATNAFDEIRVGNTFADVVPEPTSLAAMAVLGGLALLRRRRA
jgi:hypothetical protein